MLKARKPTNEDGRLKFLLYGDFGTGKTTCAIQFPRSYIFDTERGTAHYADALNKSNSVVLHSANCQEIIEELVALEKEKHDFKTVIIDSFTMLEADLMVSLYTKYPSQDDARVWRDRDRMFRKLLLALLRLDMNVIVVLHQKQKYGKNFEDLGVTFSGWKNLPYAFDLVLELQRRGDKRAAVVKKSRYKQFADGETFDFSYDLFCEKYGKDRIEKSAVPVVTATAEQVAELTGLLEKVKLPEGTAEKWLEKAQVETFAEMSTETIGKCIAHVAKILKG